VETLNAGDEVLYVGSTTRSTNRSFLGAVGRVLWAGERSCEIEWFTGPRAGKGRTNHYTINIKKLKPSGPEEIEAWRL